MAGFLDTSGYYEVQDGYSSYFQKAEIFLGVSAEGKVSWTIVMRNDRVGSSGRGVYLSVKIADKEIGPGKYVKYNDPNSADWLTYPTGNGSFKDGSFTLEDTSVKSIDIKVTIVCMQEDLTKGVTETFTLTRKRWTEVNKGSIEITDHGNNYFSIEATAGEKGTNNPVTGNTLNWGYNSTCSTGVDSLSIVNKPLTIVSNAATRTVYAKLTTKGTYGNDAVVTASKNIVCYIKPGAPGTPTLSEDSKKNGRLTVKKNWTYTWNAATPANNKSPVKGYRIAIYKNNIAIKGLTSSTSNNTIGKGTGTTAYVDRLSTSTTITFDPVALGFKPGDTVQVEVQAYTLDAKTNRYSSATSKSTATTVQNAGIVHVRVDNKFREGQVYVRVNGNWQEASSVHTKVSGSWKEST